jgi:hypothetical protein
LSSALTDGPPSALATPPTSSSAVSAIADCATVAIARHESAVAVAAIRMPASAPMRSTSRPAGVELSAHITWKIAIARPTRVSPNVKSSGIRDARLAVRNAGRTPVIISPVPATSARRPRGPIALMPRS